MYAFQRFGTPLFPKYRRVSWNNKRFHPKAIFQAIAYSDKRGFIIFPVRVTRCVGRTSPLVKNYDKGGRRGRSIQTTLVDTTRKLFSDISARKIRLRRLSASKRVSELLAREIERGGVQIENNHLYVNPDIIPPVIHKIYVVDVPTPAIVR